MNKNYKLIAAILALNVAASAHAETTVQQKVYNLPHCSRPAATLVIGKMVCKAASCKNPQSGGHSGLLAQLMDAAGQPAISGIGDGMGDMLLTSLKSTGCFDIQEREAMDEIAKELALVGKKVEAKPADFMISGAITSVNMSSSRSSFGGGFIPVLGAINKKTQKADIGMDIRVINVNQAKILDSRTIEANSENSSYGFMGGGIAGFGGFGGSLSSLKGTALEDVARDAIAQATTYIVQTLVPGAQVQPVAAPPAAAH